MRSAWSVWCWVAAAAFAGCGLDVVEVSVTETGGAGMVAVQFPGMGQFGSSLGRALSDKDVDPSDVDSLKPISARLVMTSQGGLTSDLSFLHDLAFLASATGLDGAVLASQASFPSGTRASDLAVPEDLELKPFLEAGDMAITVDATLDPPPPDLVELQVTFRFRVDANVM